MFNLIQFLNKIYVDKAIAASDFSNGKLGRISLLKNRICENNERCKRGKLKSFKFNQFLPRVWKSVMHPAILGFNRIKR